MTTHVAPFRGPAAEWDAFVRAQGDWTHFHLLGWRAVVERVFGHECVYLEARDDAGTRIGVLPLVRVRSVVFGHYLVSMPFVNYGGPLGTDEGIRALADEAVALATAQGVRLLEFRSARKLPLPLPVSHRKITVVLDLPDDPQELWRRLGGKLRSQVRRPQKAGVTVEFGSGELDGFFDVFSHHMRDLGTPTQPRRYFEAIRDTFGDSAWFGCAYLDGQPIAAGCALRWGDELEMTWASSLLSHKQLAPNMLLYWSFMERAVLDGARTFNFGRCSPGSGTHTFKLQWGSREVPLWWYQHSAGAVQGTPSPKDSAYAWGPAVWKRLPTSVATALGPRIVRYIP